MAKDGYWEHHCYQSKKRESKNILYLSGKSNRVIFSHIRRDLGWLATHNELNANKPATWSEQTRILTVQRRYTSHGAHLMRPLCINLTPHGCIYKESYSMPYPINKQEKITPISPPQVVFTILNRRKRSGTQKENEEDEETEKDRNYSWAIVTLRCNGAISFWRLGKNQLGCRWGISAN